MPSEKYQARGVVSTEGDGRNMHLFISLEPIDEGRAIQVPMIEYQPPLTLVSEPSEEKMSRHWVPADDAEETDLSELPKPSRRFSGGWNCVADAEPNEDAARGDVPRPRPTTWAPGICGRCQLPVIDFEATSLTFDDCNRVCECSQPLLG